MSEVLTYKIGDICTITRGGSPRPIQDFIQEHGTPWVKIADAAESSRYIRKTKEFIKPEGEKRSRVVYPGDFILSNSATPGLPRFLKIRACIHDGWLLLRDFKEDIIDKIFLQYLLVKEREALLIQGNGSIFTNLKTEILKNHSITIPCLSEQQAIAEVLSSLDDKIDLLHRQNQTLEQMAETLFRQWFIEEAKEEREEFALEEIATIQNGYAFNSNDYVEMDNDVFEVVKMGHIEKGGGLRSNPKRDYVPRESHLFKWVLNKGDIIMAMTDMKDNVVILGVPAMIDKDDHYVLNQRVARIFLKNNDVLLSKYFLYIQLKDPQFIATLQSKANSGVQVNLSTSAIRESTILIPPLKIQQKLVKTIDDLYLRKESNDDQLKTLEKMRDTLLPKLMSGEVRVKMY